MRWCTASLREDDLPPSANNHYKAAGKAKQARYYATLAGIHAASQFANAEAIDFFGTAIQLSEDRLDLYHLHLLREKLYDLQGQREAQLADLEALKDLATFIPDSFAFEAIRYEGRQIF